MKTQVMYFCEKCNAVFDKQKDCEKHEKQCGANITIIKYQLEIDHNDSNFDINITKQIYNGSKTTDGNIILNNNNFPYDESFFNFDTLQGNYDNFSIYTTENTIDNDTLIKMVRDKFIKKKEKLEEFIKKFENANVSYREIIINNN